MDELTKHAIPELLARKGWDAISSYLRYLRRTLLDLSSDCAQRALKNILKVSEVAEETLLRTFLECLAELMDDNDNPRHIRQCQELVRWLHTFNSGQTLQKCFIYAVIEKRMPKVMQQSPGGGSHKQGEHSAIDNLSELFWTIGTVCTEQFGIIRQVFPAAIVPQMTRTLIQRIYNDPAFGIQGRVDNVIHPAVPLPLSEYLESLLTVREKLAALYIILLELCSHPAMHGMGRENTHAGKNQATEDANFGGMSGGMGMGMGKPVLAKVSEEDLQAAQDKSLIEVREFLDEQNTQVLSMYMGDYFYREQTHIRNQYAESLLWIFGDGASAANSLVSSGEKTPRLRAERMGGIPAFVNSVCNGNFVRNTLRLTTDCIMRMQSIARDEHKLPIWIKDLFVLQVEFLLDGVVVPSLKECANVLLKKAAKGAVNTAVPPMEFLKVLTFACAATVTLRANMEDVFIAPLRDLGSNGNMLVVCREFLRNALKPVDSLCKEGLKAWSSCITFHTERLLSSMQSKRDYADTFLHTHAHTSTSAACEAVCKTLNAVAKAITDLNTEFTGLDLDECFWRPFGRQFVGALISHLRRLRISEEGAATLLLDLDQYLSALRMFECKENIDMMLCLKEVAQVYAVSSDKVKKVVVENLRHLDTDLVLALTKARSDYGVLQMTNEHWTRTIAATYSFSKWDHELPWEKGQGRQDRRIVSGFGLSSNAAEAKGAAPTTLRKTSAKMSSLYIEMALSKQREQRASTSGGGGGGDSGDGGGDGGGDSADGRTSEPVQGEQLHKITGPSSFAAAMTARFTASMPFRPTDAVPAAADPDAAEERHSTGFRPLTFMSNIIHGAAAAVARPDLIGRESLPENRESVFLISKAKTNLSKAEEKQQQQQQEQQQQASATPMRDSMRNLFGSLTGSSGGQATGAEASAGHPAKKPEPAQERPKSGGMFSSFGFGRSKAA